MTGFGLGESFLGEGKVTVEIRSLNHRFLDIRLRLPRPSNDLAAFIEQLARNQLHRGRYEITVRAEGPPFETNMLNIERAHAAYQSLCAIRDELSPHSEVPLVLLNSIPDLFICAFEKEIDALRASLRKAFEFALDSLNTMRIQEGCLLHEDLCQRLNRIRHYTASIQERAPHVYDLHRKRLLEKIDRIQLTTSIEINFDRLEQEVVFLAERMDIAEELTRIESHCVHFLNIASESEAIGRKLDFLLQELTREINTLGAKSYDVFTSHAVVKMKAELERMREQVQNIE
ncbi:YicC/YloC family endoribonuclease [Pajaroellobacter abortibovis]|nr:YicC/YloC family endoribonuclease [Pajaroellobacter abortibovis]